MNRADHLWGTVCALLSALGFAGKAILIKAVYAKAPIDAVTLLALRMAFSLPLFLWMGWRAARNAAVQPLTRTDWRNIALMGFLGYYFSSFLDFWALEYISAALERVILFTYPTFVLLLSALFLGRRVTGRDAAALALSMAGIAVTFGNDLSLSGPSRSLWMGGGLVMGASLVYALYLIFSGDVIRRVGSRRFTPYVSLTAAVFVLAHFFLTRPAHLLAQPRDVLLLCVGLALFSTVLPIVFLVEALKRVTAGTVAIVSSIGPVLTIAMGYVFLGEPITVAQIGGAALVLAGVSWISRPAPANQAA